MIAPVPLSRILHNHRANGDFGRSGGLFGLRNSPLGVAETAEMAASAGAAT